MSKQTKKKKKKKNPNSHYSWTARSLIHKVLVIQSCLTLCNPMDCSLPGSSVNGILQERILKWVAISFSRGFSQPRDWIWVSWIADRFFTIWSTRETLHRGRFCIKFFDFTGRIMLHKCKKLQFCRQSKLPSRFVFLDYEEKRSSSWLLKYRPVIRH